MRIALSEMIVEGIQTNMPLHQELMLDAAFMRGGTSIHYLEEKLSRSKAGRTDGTARVRRTAMAWISRQLRRSKRRRLKRSSDALLEHGALSRGLADAAADAPGERALFGEPGAPA